MLYIVLCIGTELGLSHNLEIFKNIELRNMLGCMVSNRALEESNLSVSMVDLLNTLVAVGRMCSVHV